MEIFPAQGIPGPQPEANLATIAGWAAEAAAAGASVLLTPELFCTARSTTPGGWLRTRLARIARQAGIYLVASTPEQDDKGTYVAASLWDPHGQLRGHVRKMRPTPGQLAAGFSGWDGRPVPVPVDGRRFALVLGNDAAAPVYRLYLRSAGATDLFRLEPGRTSHEAVAAPEDLGLLRAKPAPRPEPVPPETGGTPGTAVDNPAAAPTEEAAGTPDQVSAAPVGGAPAVPGETAPAPTPASEPPEAVVADALGNAPTETAPLASRPDTEPKPVSPRPYWRAVGWAPKNSGVPFPQAGPLPEPLLRPLPQPFHDWIESLPAAATPARGQAARPPRTGGS